LLRLLLGELRKKKKKIGMCKHQSYNAGEGFFFCPISGFRDDYKSLVLLVLCLVVLLFQLLVFCCLWRSICAFVWGYLGFVLIFISYFLFFFPGRIF